MALSHSEIQASNEPPTGQARGIQRISSHAVVAASVTHHGTSRGINSFKLHQYQIGARMAVLCRIA
jgi:hypothetical protein